MASKKERAVFANKVKAQANDLIKLIDSAAANNSWTTAEFRKWERMQLKAIQLINNAVWVVKESAKL